MAVVFGDKAADGWVQVTCIQWQLDSHKDGYSVKIEDIPKTPTPPRGKVLLQMYHPERNEWRFDEIDRPFTTEELLEDLTEAVRELTAVIKERM